VKGQQERLSTAILITTATTDQAIVVGLLPKNRLKTAAHRPNSIKETQ